MNHLLGAVAAVAPPRNAKQPLETLARIWADKPGGRTRQIQSQSTAALPRWAVAERRLGEDWEPPQDLTVFVGRSRAAKAITTPLEVEHILFGRSYGVSTRPRARSWCPTPAAMAMPPAPT